jgi:FKBP-type peptidyl-prolyl cis-trans isomerase 2
MATVNQGDVVRIHYTGRLDDGTVFDDSREREPLEFEAGGDNVIQGVSQGVIGMEEGETKKVTVPPKEGYGDRIPSLEQTVSRSDLPEGVEEGMQLRAVQGDREIPVWVRKLDEENAVIDANHPLAGKTLEFDLELVSVGEGES